ncbi:hypothetical protein [Nonomuraea sp. NPDC001831]|uniref:hypothetical protein n=1 Tax=Nonomuraea sp. NPDC001831 TaxID=3364340 RepID=UPI0036CE7B8A
MPRRPPRLTRTHATALLLTAPAGEPDRTVLVLTEDAALGYATPEAVLTGGGINLADNTEVLRDGLPVDALVSVGRPLPTSVPLGEGA